MNIIPHTPIFIPRVSIFNSTPCTVELYGINVDSTQVIAYSTQKKVLFRVSISYSTCYSTFGAWNKTFFTLFDACLFYSTLASFIPHNSKPQSVVKVPDVLGCENRYGRLNMWGGAASRQCLMGLIVLLVLRPGLG